MQTFKDKFNELCRVEQKALVLLHCTSSAVKRRRGKEADPRRSIAAVYKVRLENGKEIRVCHDMFCAVLAVGHSTVARYIKHKHERGELKPDRRGGDQKFKRFCGKRSAVVRFIQRLHARESLYNRKKTKRLYLPVELKSIRNLWKIYNEQAPDDARVKYGFFHHIFRTKFNLSFRTPRTDVCSVCLKNAYEMKTCQDASQKQHIITEQRVHRLKYKAFYSMLREKREDLKTFSFDCQQNQVLPKVPDQEAYYSRQLYQYHLCVVEHQVDGSMPKEAVHSYTWSEDESSKGSNQVGSAVYNTLRSAKFEGIREVRLVADGCAGQNRNSTVLCMLLWWLQNEAPSGISAVFVVFPLTGYSFLPPDRVFGRIEKDVRKLEEIQNPQSYRMIFSNHGTVLELGKHWDVYNWKTYCSAVMKSKSSLPFKITETKDFYIQRNAACRSPKIRAEPHYKVSISNFVPVLKRGRSLAQAPVQCALYTHHVNEMKLKDVTSFLVKHFGNSWQENEDLGYFVNVLTRAQENNDHSEELEDSCLCCEDNSPTVRV